MRAIFAWCLLASAQGSPAQDDLKRARTMKPRSGFRGSGSLSAANVQLNKHIKARNGLKSKPCEDFSVTELRDVLKQLHPASSDELKAIYAEHDGRHPKHETIADLEKEWTEKTPVHDHRVRDGHCHEAVMWFVHHLTTAAQEEIMKALTLPQLPTADHRLPKDVTRDENDHAGKFYDAKVTCQACHVGGIDTLGLPEVKPADEHSRKRRCYTNYKELFGIDCGPCDGVGGPYSGDDDKFFTATECVVVGTPAEIPENERVKNVLPPQFSVDVVGGSDRFGRTTNPINDQLPGPIAKIYGQISGKWYMDAKADSDLWMLRHDTVYGSVTENGVPIPFIKPSVTEIHAQTKKMRDNNNTGPMVSLIHGMPDFLPGGCTCMPDPVGVPDITASSATTLAEMKYMGRIKLTPIEYLGVTVELDHWANWFFHIFMETNKTSPYYGKAPRRLASAYAGTAVYDNWVMEDPKIKNPDIWHRGIPQNPEKVGPSKGKYCLDTKKIGDYCGSISASTFPESLLKWTPSAAGAPHASRTGTPFFPNHDLAEHISSKDKVEILV